MQRTDGYQIDTCNERARAVAWLRRQDRWDQRLRALEGATPGPVLGTRRPDRRATPVPARTPRPDSAHR
ncbi:MAG TPA: hypothetical protein VI462_18590 [Acidimicrobiia bacterium]